MHTISFDKYFDSVFEELYSHNCVRSRVYCDVAAYVSDIVDFATCCFDCTNEYARHLKPDEISAWERIKAMIDCFSITVKTSERDESCLMREIDRIEKQCSPEHLRGIGWYVKLIKMFPRALRLAEVDVTIPQDSIERLYKASLQRRPTDERKSAVREWLEMIDAMIASSAVKHVVVQEKKEIPQEILYGIQDALGVCKKIVSRDAEEVKLDLERALRLNGIEVVWPGEHVENAFFDVTQDPELQTQTVYKPCLKLKDCLLRGSVGVPA